MTMSALLTKWSKQHRRWQLLTAVLCYAVLCTPLQVLQQLTQARELAVSSRTAEQRVQDIQECSQLFGLEEVGTAQLLHTSQCCIRLLLTA
jgi:hypothetical protein